jgi:hypothetical protein
MIIQRFINKYNNGKENNFNLLDYIEYLDRKIKKDIEVKYEVKKIQIENNEKFNDAQKKEEQNNLQKNKKENILKSLIILQKNSLNLVTLNKYLGHSQTFFEYLEKQGFKNLELEDSAVKEEVFKELKEERQNNNTILTSKDYLSKEIPASDKSFIQDLLDKYNVRVKGKKLVARIHKKTDPKGWVSGDYTDCCMRYGTDKNYDYMNNKSTAYFSISLEDDRGDGDMIAQSVLVAAVDKTENSQKYLSKEKEY